MSAEYTPTTDLVKSAYVFAEVEVSPRGDRSLAEMEAEFDRWHAEEKRAASEEALRGAADSAQAKNFSAAIDLTGIRGSLFIKVDRWLHRVADKYRKE